MKHILKELPFAVGALEPYISASTVEVHYGRHHAGYVDKLNAAVSGTSFASATLEELVRTACDVGGAGQAVFNNAAQVWNHDFYWSAFSASCKAVPEGRLLQLLQQGWGSFEAFKLAFEKSALSLFGSGWCWLVVDSDGRLGIRNTANADTPLRTGAKPLLTCDVWEHAYYLDYQNRRDRYLSQFWNIVDWKVVEQRLADR